MNISRNFLVIGVLYLIVGICFGIYMGASDDHTLAPVHAHINLLGFTLMTLFGILYRVIPTLAGSALARWHFWLHQLGVLVLLVLLAIFMSGMAGEGIMVPAAPIAEVAILLGIVLFAINLFRNA